MPHKQPESGFNARMEGQGHENVCGWMREELDVVDLLLWSGLNSGVCCVQRLAFELAYIPQILVQRGV